MNPPFFGRNPHSAHSLLAAALLEALCQLDQAAPSLAVSPTVRSSVSRNVHAGQGQGPPGVRQVLAKHSQHQTAADGVAVQHRHFNAAIAAFVFPLLMSTAGHAVKELGGLYVAVFGVAIGLRVVAHSHPHCKKCSCNFRRFDASLRK